MKRPHVPLYFSLLIPALTIMLVGVTSGCGSARSTVTSTDHPLVAQYNVVVNGAGTVWVEFGLDTNYGRQTSQFASNPGDGVLPILVAGMKPSSTYHMRAHADWADGSKWVDKDQTFRTGPLPSQPASAPFPVVSVSRPTVPGASPAPGVELFSFASRPAVVVDLDGNIIW